MARAGASRSTGGASAASASSVRPEAPTVSAAARPYRVRYGLPLYEVASIPEELVTCAAVDHQ